MTPATLLIPLAVLAAAAGLGWLGHRQPPGKHQRAARRRPQWPGWLPSLAWHRQATPHRRALRQAIEEAHHAAWVARVEHHQPGPLRAAQLEVAAITATLPSWAEPATGPIWPPMWAPVPAQDGPVPAAMADVDDDPDYPHLASGQYGDWATGQFAAVSDSIEGE